jgi:hypothetical protein
MFSGVKQCTQNFCEEIPRKKATLKTEKDVKYIKTIDNKIVYLGACGNGPGSCPMAGFATSGTGRSGCFATSGTGRSGCFVGGFASELIDQ